MIRLKIMAAITTFTMICRFTFPVLAEDSTFADDEYWKKGSGVVWSEQEVDGWNLSWESVSFFDTLVSAWNDETCIVYSYNEDGTRASKCVNGRLTTYEYENGYLIAERTLGHEIKYIYGIIDYNYKITGFTYNGQKYNYICDNGIIVGIEQNGYQIAEYKYFNDICEAVYSVDTDGEVTDASSDMKFIGNVNPIRYNQNYYDSETGWYYMGRYYCAGLGRFVDGVSPQRADELKKLYPEWEIITKTYTEGCNIFNDKGRAGGESEQTVVAKVIMLESPYNSLDQNCVAWVIKNRMNSKNQDFAGVTTAYQVVTQASQFSTYKCDEYNNFSSFTAMPLWPHANELAAKLVNYLSMPSIPSGVIGKLYFSSISKIYENGKKVDDYILVTTVDESGNIVKVKYYDCWILPIGDISPSNFKNQLEEYYLERPRQYNIFCNKQFK